MLGSMPGGSDFLCLCAKQMSPTPAACRSVSRSARSEILPLQAQRQVALESHLVAVGEPFRFGGDRAEQVDQRFRLALVIAATDMAGHAVLRSEEHTSELQVTNEHLVFCLMPEKKK